MTQEKRNLLASSVSKNKQNEANEHFRKGAYKEVRNPREAQFNEIMRSLEEATFTIR